MFQPIPSVDIRGGRCVRLRQGDYNRETVYGGDPVAMAQRWEAEGAQRLHVVDLDGARDGVRQNTSVIAAIVSALDIPVQVGGGIRTLQAARDLLDTGVARVVLGTVAVEKTDLLAEWLVALEPARVVIAVDARDGRVASRGWLQDTGVDALELCHRLEDAGAVRILYTDISRDGMLDGPNVAAIERLVHETSLQVIASGGVRTTAQLAALAEAGAEGAIIGKALYDGALSLADALANAVGSRG